MKPSDLFENENTVSQRVPFRLDMTPMVDIAFLLLTFFMLTAVYQKPSNLSVSLPEKKEQKGTTSASNTSPLTIEITPSNQFKLSKENGDQFFSISEIQKMINTDLAKHKSQGVILKASKKSSYQSVVTLMDLVQFMGIEKLQLEKSED